MGKTLVEMAADIVQAQSASTGLAPEEVAVALQKTFNALQSLQTAEANSSLAGVEGDAKTVDVIPERSILKNKIICLECGEEFRMLSPKHLKSHGLTGREYRSKHGFSLRQPLCAKALSERRKKAGKARGLPENLKKAIAKRKKTSKAGRGKKK